MSASITNIKRLHFVFLTLVIFTCFLFGLQYVAREQVDQTKALLQLLKHNRIASEATLGNFTQFRLLISSDICSAADDSNIYMLILVGSHPKHVHLRNVLRSTLARPEIKGHAFKMAFTFGQLQNESDQSKLEDESRRHGDIIQGNFIDSYHNVTLRDLMGLRWAWQNCAHVHYVMRMDDDISVDVYRLVAVLKQCCSMSPVFMGCFQVWSNAPVRRTGRYAVTRESHPKPIFDNYCDGWMYVLTPAMAYLLDWATSNVTYYWMNDAYITGSLVKALGLNHTHLELKHTDDVQLMKAMLNNGSTKYGLGPTEAHAHLYLALFKHYKRNWALQLSMNSEN